MTTRNDLLAALSAALHSVQPSEERATLFTKQPGVVGDELDQFYEHLVRCPDTAMVNRSYVIVNGEPVAQLNPSGIAYGVCQRSSQVGPERAIDELIADLHTTRLRCHSTVIAGGPCPAVVANIGDGISLVPFRAAQEEPIWKSRLQALAPEDNFIEASGPACLWTKTIDVDFRLQVQPPEGWQGLPGKLPHRGWGPYVQTFEPAVQLTALQEGYLPPAYPIVHWIQPSSAFRFPFTYFTAFARNGPALPILITSSLVDDLRALNGALVEMRNKRPEDAERFCECLRRLHRTFFAGLLHDVAIEARLALETTFTKPGYEPYPKSRVAGNVKLYLGKVKGPRGVHDPIAIYDHMSGPAHGAPQGPTPEFTKSLDGAVKVTTEGLRKILQDGGLPDWDALRAGAKARSKALHPTK